MRMTYSSPWATTRIDSVASYQSEKNKARASTRGVDARHAIRLTDVMTPSDAREQPFPAPKQQPAKGREVSVAKMPTIRRTGGKAPLARDRMPSGERADVMGLTAEEGGAVTQIRLKVYADSDDIRGETCQVRLLTQSCIELSLRVGEISAETLRRVTQAEALCRAVVKCMELLGYGSMSRRRMEQKLMSRGFDRAVISQAVTYMSERGYLDESDTAERFARRDVSKLWGPRRIKEDLFARGFAAEIVEEALAALEDVDFFENCAVLLTKKYREIPQDAPARRKLIAALMRQGYTSEHISYAMKSHGRD